MSQYQHFTDYLRVLYKRRWVAAAAFILVFAYSATTSLRKTPIYEATTQLLIENPINRYLINSPMLPALKKNADGSLTLHIQHTSPGPDRESNWLPAPAGKFILWLRVYIPGEAILHGEYAVPPVVEVR